MTAHAALLLLLVSGAAHADGGSVRIQQEAGPFRITVFSAPEPLRAGSADFSVLVQRRDGDAPILDAEVALRLEGPPPARPIDVRATHDAATNKVLYAALVWLPSAGDWTLHAVVRDGGDAASVASPLAVAPRVSRLLTLWPYLALPPLVVLLFATREWLRRRRGPPRPFDAPL